MGWLPASAAAAVYWCADGRQEAQPCPRHWTPPLPRFGTAPSLQTLQNQQPLLQARWHWHPAADLLAAPQAGHLAGQGALQQAGQGAVQQAGQG